MKRVCEWCGTSIDHRPKTATYCSEEHAALAVFAIDRAAVRTCDWCGVSIGRMPEGVRYCSAAHRRAALEVARTALVAERKLTSDHLTGLRALRHALALLGERRDRLVREAVRMGHDYGVIASEADIPRHQIHRVAHS